MTPQPNGGDAPAAPAAACAPVVIPRRLAIRLMSEALKASEREVCGLVGIGDGEPHSIYPITNESSEFGRDFRLSPQDQLDALQLMHARAERLWAVYHSLPLGAAPPQDAQITDCGYPEALQLVVSLDTKGVLQLRCWKVAGGTPVEHDIRIPD